MDAILDCRVSDEEGPFSSVGFRLLVVIYHWSKVSVTLYPALNTEK